MKRNIIYLIILLLFTTMGILNSQTSSWKDHNPYATPIQTDDVIIVDIKEQFIISSKGEWGKNGEINLTLNPDTANFEFLTKSQQSKKSSEKNSFSIKSNDTVEMKMPARVVEVLPRNTYRLEGKKTISMDEKPVAISFSGIVSGRNIVNYRVSSSQVADLSILIRMRIPDKNDTTIQMKQKPADPQTNQPGGPEAKLSDAEKENLKLRQIREILGAMQ